MNSGMYMNRATKKSAERAMGQSRFAVVELLLALIEKILSIRVSPLAVKIIRAVLSVLCVIGFIGVIGGIESGTISFAGGVLAGLSLTFAEVLILRD